MQKHEKVSFGVSVVCRSMKKFHLVFLTCAEARKSFIWCFCREQKNRNPLFLGFRKSISNNKRGFQSLVDEINEKNIFFLSNQIAKSEILFNFEGEF